MTQYFVPKSLVEMQVLAKDADYRKQRCAFVYVALELSISPRRKSVLQLYSAEKCLKLFCDKLCTAGFPTEDTEAEHVIEVLTLGMQEGGQMLETNETRGLPECARLES